ncbi:MAG: TatD family hydrolase [Desulfonatronovibrionaceae bacterium]
MSRKKTRLDPWDLGLPPGGADSHAHLNMLEPEQQLDRIMSEASRTGISSIGQVFLGSRAYLEQKHFFEDYPGLFFILGVHPHDASGYDQDEEHRLVQAFSADPRLKAAGEIGLDYYYHHSPSDIQAQVFKAQLDLARSMDLPVVIHSRDAFQETMDILRQCGFQDRPVLWHCFGYGIQEARQIMDMGWQISIPGSITYKKNTRLRESLAAIDLDRMLLETDCPFLAPDPYRGRPNHPALLAFTNQTAAEVLDMDPARLWVKTGQNCRRFFGLD